LLWLLIGFELMLSLINNQLDEINAKVFIITAKTTSVYGNHEKFY